MDNSYNAGYAIPDPWLKGLIDHGDCPSDVHNAQYDLYCSIIDRHPHLDIKLQSASSYITSWAFMACTDNERLRLWPVLRYYKGSVFDLFEFADRQHLSGVCPKAEELLDKLDLHLKVVSEVSMYRTWIQIAGMVVKEEDAEASLEERFLDANGTPFTKPRFPSGFYVMDPLFRSWYMPSHSKIATKYEPSSPMLDDDIEDNNNEPEQRLTIKLDSTKSSLKAFIKFCTSLQKFEHTTFRPFNDSRGEKAPKVDDFGLCSIDLCDEYLFPVAPVPSASSTPEPLNSNEAVKEAESLQGWEDLGVAPLQVKEGDWEFV